MADITMARVKSGAKLLKALLKKVDAAGDGVLTEAEVRRAVSGTTREVRYGKDGLPIPAVGRDGKPLPIKLTTVDQPTVEALLAAVWKRKSATDRSLTGIVAGVDEALAEITSANDDGSARITAAEQKRVKSPLGKKLLEFSRLHGGDKVASFRLAKVTAEVYVPSRPFKAPAGASPDDMVEALMKHFNAFSNDNRSGPGADNITRYVLGAAETKGVAAAIGDMTATTARAVLRALSKRIKMADDRASGFKPRRVWIEPKAVPTLEKLAATLGVKAGFSGVPGAPKYDYTRER